MPQNANIKAGAWSAGGSEEAAEANSYLMIITALSPGYAGGEGFFGGGHLADSCFCPSEITAKRNVQKLSRRLRSDAAGCSSLDGGHWEFAMLPFAAVGR